jgi:HSP20 family protein
MNLVKFNRKNEKALMPGVDDIFESIFNDTFFSDRMVNHMPAVNIRESEDRFHIEMAVPGLKKEDFKISVDRGQLTISADKQSKKDDRKFNRREYSCNSFVRAFTLPDVADQENIEASYEDGVLKINVAKKEEAKTVSRQIELK